MNLVLVDASAWIDYLRSGEGSLSETLEKLLDDDRAALCGVAITEVRQGLRPHEEGDVLDLFATLPFVDSGRTDYERAGELLAGLRQRGTTIPTMDGVMAAVCLGRDMTLLEFDKHYREIDRLECVPWRDA